MAITQDNRIMNISTPLGKDFLLISSFRAEEEISKLFTVEAELVHEETQQNSPPTVIDIQNILGKNVCIEVIQRDGTKRYFNGIVNRFSQGSRNVRFTSYRMEIVPQLWLLTQIRQSKIFQEMTVPDILRQVLGAINFKIEVQGQFEKRNFCVQYRETDFDFISRLMEEEGIFYYFEHTNQSHQMIIANTPSSHRDCPTKSSIEFVSEVNEEEYVTTINQWVTDYNLQTGKVAMWDHHFELPTNKFDAKHPSRFNVGGNQQLEIYDYPGGYARKFDGIDKGGGERPADLQKIFPDKQKTVETVMRSLDTRHKTASGTSDCSSITPGYRFELKNHPIRTSNGQYVITSVSHTCNQSPDYHSESEVGNPYTNAFDCLAHGAGAPPFHPLQTTPKPVVQGSQTATVVGPSGEEIFTDKYGRIKVQFHWDRFGSNDQGSSCWVRVSQNWAGKKWGTMFIPRIGMEVIIDFFEGDPDQPIAVGCVYNAETMPPYTLPDEKTKSTIKTNSSPGGNGFNELRFEDKKGSEQIFIHAEKNQDIRVKNDCMEIVENNRSLIVKKDQMEKVGGDKHLQVSGSQNEKIGGSVGQNIGGSHDEKVSQKFAVDAGQEIHLKAGMTTVIEAGTSLTLKVGGNFININSGGVFVKGTMVMLNSGGAAGSGSGASPGSPKDPVEADNAQTGQKVARPPNPPPPPEPPNFALVATAARESASNPLVPNVQQLMQQILAAIPPVPPIPVIPPVPAPDLPAAIAQAQAAVENLVSDARAMARNAVAQVVNSPLVGAAMDKVNQARAMAEDVAQKAQDKINEAKAVAADIAGQAQDKIDQAKAKVDEAKQKVEEVKQEVAEAKQKVDEAKQVVESYAEALEGVGEQAAGMAQAAQDAVPFL
ncbi:MAG: type VI secretion system tip protein TssI/VgrG [Blastocatellia bacterium]